MFQYSIVITRYSIINTYVHNIIHQFNPFPLQFMAAIAPSYQPSPSCCYPPVPTKSYNKKIRRTFSLQSFQQKLPQNTDGTCRICLESCPYLQLCSCRGSSMIHINCLKQYIAKGQGTIKNKSKCELCGEPYNLIFTKRCIISCASALNYLKTNILFSIIFAVFTLLTLGYIGYCSYIYMKGDLNDNLQLVLLIIGICMVIVLVIVFLRWMYLYLFVTVNVLIDIKEVEGNKIEVTKDTLNDSQQYLR